MEFVTPSKSQKRGLDTQQYDSPDATSPPVASKKRRLNDATSPSTPRQIGSAIASAISSVLGFGLQQQQQQQKQLQKQQQQQPPHQGTSGPEPLAETSPNIGASATQLKSSPEAAAQGKARPAIKVAALKGTKWDNGQLETGSPSPKKPGRVRKTLKKDPIADSGKAKESPKPSVRRGQGRNAQQQTVEDPMQRDATGRPCEEGERPAGDGEQTASPKEIVRSPAGGRGKPGGRGRGRGGGRGGGSGRGRGRRPKDQDVLQAAGSHESATEESPSKAKSVKRLGLLRRQDEDADSTADELSSNELQGVSPLKHRTFDLNMRLAASSAKSPTPKSILSPSKKDRSQIRKSVSFHGNAGDVFFEDLPKSLGAKKSPRQSKLAKPVEPDSDADEIVCAVCSRPDSEAPNEIILCDNCDFAAHQVCYGVPEIPEGDWLCKACTQEDILDGSPSQAAGVLAEGDAASTPVVVEEVPDIPHLDHHLRSLQRVLLDRCAGRRRLRMSGQEEAYEKAQQLVEQTVNAGEGNSMLLIGPRGCGKTTMVENILADLSRQHRRDFFVVRLNGFIHTDDKLALKEIWRQLGKEMKVEDDLLNRSNYADTMASLLALLSHPSEILGTDDGLTCQSVIFVIDEFDMFAAHPRQTLLYNLFDIAQSRKAPIAVLGCTTRLDVVEMLEKRVKSRFSHRYVYLSLPRGIPAYWQICRQGLMMGDVEPEEEGIDARVEGHAEFHRYWNGRIQELYDQPAFQELLQYHFYTTKSPSAFFNEWLLPLSAVSSSNLTLAMPASPETTSLIPPDSRLQLLSTLSDLELGLLIAGARLDIVADIDTVNFAMVYDEYSSLVGRQRAQSATAGMLAIGGGARVWSRGVAGIAWERLITLGLLVPAGVGGVNSRLTGHGGLDGKMWRIDVALEEIPGAVKLSTVSAKWCKEL